MKTKLKLGLILLLVLLTGSIFVLPGYGNGTSSARILLIKTSSKTKVTNGTTVSYLYNATNTGQTPLTGMIYDDQFGSVGSFVDLQPGGWVGFNQSHIITANTTNIATAMATNPDGINVTDSAFAFIQVYAPTSGLLLTKTSSKTKVANGTTVSYLYNATNTGQTPLNGTITDDKFGTVGSFELLQPGGWVGFNQSHIITANTTNIATATAINSAGAPVTDSAIAYVQVYNLKPDILLTKTPSKTKVTSGTTVSYLYNATNTGQTPLNGTITDDKFGTVGSFELLQPGGWVAFNVSHTITCNTTNIATVVATDTYGTTITDSAIAFVKVYCSVGPPGFVVPEFPFGTIMATATMIGAFATFLAISKKKKRENSKP